MSLGIGNLATQPQFEHELAAPRLTRHQALPYQQMIRPLLFQAVFDTPAERPVRGTVGHDNLVEPYIGHIADPGNLAVQQVAPARIEFDIYGSARLLENHHPSAAIPDLHLHGQRIGDYDLARSRSACHGLAVPGLAAPSAGEYPQRQSDTQHNHSQTFHYSVF